MCEQIRWKIVMNGLRWNVSCSQSVGLTRNNYVCCAYDSVNVACSKEVSTMCSGFRCRGSGLLCQRPVVHICRVRSVNVVHSVSMKARMLPHLNWHYSDSHPFTGSQEPCGGVVSLSEYHQWLIPVAVGLKPRFTALGNIRFHDDWTTDMALLTICFSICGYKLLGCLADYIPHNKVLMVEPRVTEFGTHLRPLGTHWFGIDLKSRGHTCQKCSCLYRHCSLSTFTRWYDHVLLLDGCGYSV